MAAALRVQHGPGWITTALGYFGIRSELTDEFTRKRKRLHEQDSARKLLLKYKNRRLTVKYGQQAVNSSPYLAARLCTFSNKILSLVRCGFQTVAAYSSFGRTNVR